GSQPLSHFNEQVIERPSREMPAGKMNPSPDPARIQIAAEAQRKPPHRKACIEVLQRPQMQPAGLVTIFHDVDSEGAEVAQALDRLRDKQPHFGRRLPGVELDGRTSEPAAAIDASLIHQQWRDADQLRWPPFRNL